MRNHNSVIFKSVLADVTKYANNLCYFVDPVNEDGEYAEDGVRYGQVKLQFKFTNEHGEWYENGYYDVSIPMWHDDFSGYCVYVDIHDQMSEDDLIEATEQLFDDLIFKLFCDDKNIKQERSFYYQKKAVHNLPIAA